MSGNSKNVPKAAKVAIVIPCIITVRGQEVYILFIYIVCEIMEEKLG